MVMSVDKDEKGRFLPGNQASVLANRKNRENYGALGRPKTVKGEMLDALNTAKERMPEIITKMIDRAIGNDSDCPHAVKQAAAEYLMDRIYGKANQPISGVNGGNVLVNILTQLRGYKIEDTASNCLNTDTESCVNIKEIPQE